MWSFHNVLAKRVWADVWLSGPYRDLPFHPLSSSYCLESHIMVSQLRACEWGQDLSVAEWQDRKSLSFWTMQKNHLPSTGPLVSGLLDGKERNCCLVGVTIILGLCSTQYRVEGNTENCGYDPVSLTENTSQHPMQTQGLQVQEPTFLLPWYSLAVEGKSSQEFWKEWWDKTIFYITDNATQDHFYDLKYFAQMALCSTLYCPDITKLLYLLMSIKLTIF